jgi:hypothetical protein
MGGAARPMVRPPPSYQSAATGSTAPTAEPPRSSLSEAVTAVTGL